MAAKLHQGHTNGSPYIQDGWIISGQPSYIILHFLVGNVLNIMKSKCVSKLQVTTWNSYCKMKYTTQALVQQNTLNNSELFLKFKYP